MSEEPKKRSWPSIVWVGVSLLALYVLSTGPVGWLWDRGYISMRPLNAVYAPLDWSYDHFSVVRHVLDPYLRLWVRRP
jgi:hypothetical protein